MAHPNEDLVRRGYEAFAAGDVGTLNELFADDIVWHTPGRSPISGDQRGKQAVLEFFGRIGEETQGSFKLDLHDVIGNDEHVVVLSKATGQRGGKTLENNVVNVFHVTDGKVTEVWGHSEDQYAVDEFWS
jgi:ketosteroid isomerase-like protein